MKTDAIPFQFDLTDILKRARRQASRLGDVTINLPFVSIAVSPKDKERQIAREIIIRLRDRRVLSSRECCDGCIDRALPSLEKIRSTLVDKQVELSDLQDGPLYLLIDAMLLGIRAFLTYEEMLPLKKLPASLAFGDFLRPPDVKQAYFEALEVLRAHLSQCLAQVATIAGMDTPTEGLLPQYQAWQLEAYVQPPAISDNAKDV